MPKPQCCGSSTKCKRCPLRMLKEGTLPEQYAVHKRRLVRADDPARTPLEKKDLLA